jgi:exopolysaccharide biosynthesis polyprenyl glycosylphosphotransferase
VSTATAPQAFAHTEEERPRTFRRRGWLVRRMLALSDIVGLTFAFLIAELLVPHDSGGAIAPLTEVLLFLGNLPGWVVMAKLYGLYDHDEERTDHSTPDDFVGVFHLVTVGAWLMVAGASVTGLADPNFVRLAAFWATAIGLVVVGRLTARAFCRRQASYVQNTVIVGAGDVGQLVARKLLQHPEYGINVVGFVDANPKQRRPDLGNLRVLGAPDLLPRIVRLFDVDRVVIAFSGESHVETLALVRSLKDFHVQVDIVPRLFDLVSPGVGIHAVEGLPLVGLPPFRLPRSSLLLKRVVDLVLATFGLALSAPLFLYIAWRIKRESPGPVFFRQERVGAADSAFRIFKFRTMLADADEQKAEVAHLNMHAGANGDPRMFKVANDPRVTRFGAFLRRHSLDELPQLLNVVRGEMSLVGPRPLILEEDREVSDWARKRLELKPGMTGLWQVTGRNSIPFEEMIVLDYRYVKTWSVWNDLRLLFSTLPVVFGRASPGV